MGSNPTASAIFLLTTPMMRGTHRKQLTVKSKLTRVRETGIALAGNGCQLYANIRASMLDRLQLP